MIACLTCSLHTGPAPERNRSKHDRKSSKVIERKVRAGRASARHHNAHPIVNEPSCLSLALLNADIRIASKQPGTTVH
eukprot:705784-Rhodomonas_salina.2